MNNTRRIVFNTGVMNLKMIITIALSLYTSRVVLDALGVIDFGIFSVVASVVAMFGFLNASMIASLQRHLAFEIGNSDYSAVRKIFNAGLVIHIFLAVSVFVLAETAGVWFVRNHLIIPPDRMEVALWAYHFAILSFMFNIISVPFQSILSAKEKMIVIAVIGIAEAVMHLAIAFIIMNSHYDKLKLYAALMSCVFVISLIMYATVCYFKYRESRPMIVRESSLYKELTGFAGWNLFGTLAVIGRTQGVVILLNVFLGPAINAAYAVAHRLNSHLSFLSQSVTKAIAPQIVKNYGAGNRDEFMKLIFQSSKFTFYMLYIASLPLLLETDFILHVWLKSVPDYAVLFCKLIIINSLLDSFAAALIDAALATGKIRTYQIVVGSVIMLNVPFSYLALKLGAPPHAVLIICIVMSVAATFMRLRFLRRMIGLSVRYFVRDVLFPLLLVVSLTIVCTVPIIILFEQGITRFVSLLITTALVNLTAIYLIGLSRHERDYINSAIKKYI
jgi:O-antigen/teichoic acid export membrane protein